VDDEGPNLPTSRQMQWSTLTDIAARKEEGRRLRIRNRLLPRPLSNDQVHQSERSELTM
jgi:hypothetical protein